MKELAQQRIEQYLGWNLYGQIISVSMLLYVISKTIFNQFASISCPLD